ncbi:hypothetical protein ACKKBG_A23395 [Auxenochlorella protothecoides x Auxenochlorella symbiontica]
MGVGRSPEVAGTTTGPVVPGRGTCLPRRARTQRGPSRAHLVSCRAYTGTRGAPDGDPAATERVLRYPDGQERRIRYPLPTTETSEETLVEAWETLNAYKSSTGWSPRAQPALRDEANSQVPNSPLALLKRMTSPEFLARAVAEEEKLERSYRVHEGCPWPAPRPLYVLALSEGGPASGAPGALHTLRTRLPLAGVQDELNQAMGWSSPRIACSRVADGVVAFRTLVAAEAYAAELEEARGLPHASVAVVETASHALFRSTAAAQAVVVVLADEADGSGPPGPLQLAGALLRRTREERLK